MRAVKDVPAGGAAASSGRGDDARATDGAHRDVYRVWLQLIDRPWSSVAVVPSEPTPLARAVAEAGIDLARILGLQEVHFMDALGAGREDSVRLLAELTARTDAGSRVILALDPPTVNPVALPLVTRAEKVILLVRLGTTDRSFVKAMLDIVRRERIVGCVTYR